MAYASLLTALAPAVPAAGASAGLPNVTTVRMVRPAGRLAVLPTDPVGFVQASNVDSRLASKKKTRSVPWHGFPRSRTVVPDSPSTSRGSGGAFSFERRLMSACRWRLFFSDFAQQVGVAALDPGCSAGAISLWQLDSFDANQLFIGSLPLASRQASFRHKSRDGP